MRSVSTATANAIAARGTAPGYLVEIGWSAVTRIATGDDLTWNGYVWVGADVRIPSLRWTQTGALTGTLRLGNALQQWSALALNEGVAGVRIRVWAYDRSATATADPVLVFDGEGGQLTLDADTISFELAARRARALRCPRLRLIAANGFSQLPVPGAMFRWGNQRYVLQRGR